MEIQVQGNPTMGDRAIELTQSGWVHIMTGTRCFAFLADDGSMITLAGDAEGNVVTERYSDLQDSTLVRYGQEGRH